MTDQPWFLLSSDGEISIRVSNGMQVGEGSDGELLLVALPEEARVRLLIEDDGVYAEALTGFALNEADTGIPVTRCFLGHGDRIELSDSTLVLSSRFSDSYTSLGETISNGHVYRLETSDLVDTAILDRHDHYAAGDDLDDDQATSDGIPAGGNSLNADDDAAQSSDPDAVDPFSDAAREDTTLENVLADTDSNDAPEDLVPAEKMPPVPVKPVAIERRDELPRASNDSRIESSISAVVPEAGQMRQRPGSSPSVWLAIGLAAVVALIVVSAWLVGRDDSADEAIASERAPDQSSPSFRDSPIVESIDNSVATKQDRPTVAGPSQNGGERDRGSATINTAETVDDLLARPVVPERADRQATVDGPSVFVPTQDSADVERETRQRVDRLLEQAESFFQQGIWTRGEDGSAAQRFLEALALDPDNTKAQRGISRLRIGIANMRDQDAARDSRIRLDRMIEAGVSLPVQSARPSASVQREVPGPEESVAELLEQARQRMAQGFITEPAGDSAVTYAQRVLATEPNNAAAAEILDEAAGKLLATAVDLRIAGRNTAARTLVASVLDFAPDHATARRYRVEWLD